MPTHHLVTRQPTIPGRTESTKPHGSDRHPRNTPVQRRADGCKRRTRVRKQNPRVTTATMPTSWKTPGTTHHVTGLTLPGGRDSWTPGPMRAVVNITQITSRLQYPHMPGCAAALSGSDAGSGERSALLSSVIGRPGAVRANALGWPTPYPPRPAEVELRLILPGVGDLNYQQGVRVAALRSGRGWAQSCLVAPLCGLTRLVASEHRPGAHLKVPGERQYQGDDKRPGRRRPQFSVLRHPPSSLWALRRRPRALPCRRPHSDRTDWPL
jgi:hypothetical protein